MIVADTNLIAYVYIAGEKTNLARELLTRDPDWRVPALWRHEFLNVLATYARQGHASGAQARLLWSRALERFGSREEPVDPVAVLALAAGHAVSAYDAQFVTLAQRLRIALVTEDRGLQRTFPAIARSIQDFLSSAE